ncbi:hypothetical protein ACIPIN_02095 [Pseudomonas sp. NPDC087697]|uniref:hypothetical protein n=1 Tax=Pseudomonas sp. NPDC087697 TaxID=3364447 RepID=UPI003823173E
MNITATCGACGSDQLVIPEAGAKDQMVRCSKCKAEVGDKAAIQKKLRQTAEKEAEKLKAELKKKLSKIGFK